MSFDEDLEQLRDAVLGTGDKQKGTCDECDREYTNIEPDAVFDCWEDDCDGTVKSDLVRAGYI